MEARRAHNPEVVGSSPASATIKTPDFTMKSGVFLIFGLNLNAVFIWLTPSFDTNPFSWKFGVKFFLVSDYRNRKRLTPTELSRTSLLPGFPLVSDCFFVFAIVIFVGVKSGTIEATHFFHADSLVIWKRMGIQVESSRSLGMT